MRKEYHYYPYYTEIDNIKYFSYISTRSAISNEISIIRTLQSIFITADLIKSGYDVFVHISKNKIIKIDKNTQIGSERIGTMKSNKSIEKWIFENLL